MSATWQILHTADTGERLENLDTRARDFSYTKVANDFGRWQLKLPADNYVLTDFAIDNFIEFWRMPEGGRMALDFVGLICGRERVKETDGEIINLWGQGHNAILGSRIVAYAAGTAAASKSDSADDMMLAIVRENFGSSATDTARNLSAFGFTVAPDVSKAPTIERGFAWKNVHAVLKGLADTSAAQGTDLFYWLEPQENEGRLVFQFTTRTGQPGQDLTGGDVGGPVLSPFAGTLADAYYSEDYADNVNYVYGGGNDTGLARYISETYNAALVSNSIWSRREAFQDARGQTNGSVDAAASERLARGLPVARVGGRIVESSRFRYGVDWHFGDKITVDYVMQAQGIIRAVAVRVAEGVETVDTRIEAQIYDGGLFQQKRRMSPKTRVVFRPKIAHTG